VQDVARLPAIVSGLARKQRRLVERRRVLREVAPPTLTCGKRHSFLGFPYVCPEPVLVKDAFYI
jgi:hypothetical protein